MFGKSVVDSAGMIAIKTTANTMKNTNGAVPAEMRSIDLPVNPETTKRFILGKAATTPWPIAVIIITQKR